MSQTNEIVVPRQVPLIVGAIYQLIPSMGGQYVRLAAVDRRYAYVAGYENNEADFRVRKYRWPEIVIRMVGQGGGISGDLLRLSYEDGYVRLLDGGGIALFE